MKRVSIILLAIQATTTQPRNARQYSSTPTDRLTENSQLTI